MRRSAAAHLLAAHRTAFCTGSARTRTLASRWLMTASTSTSPLKASTSYGEPQRPQKAHVRNTSPRSTSASANGRPGGVEDELAEAMQSSIALHDTKSSKSIDESVTRPVSLALAPAKRPGKRKKAPSMLRQRSLSVGSLTDLNEGDPFAWLRQTVQEQRQQAGMLSPGDVSTPLSLPSSPLGMAMRVASPSSLHATATTPTASTSTSGANDYFGAGLLSLVAGKGPVRQHVSEDVRRTSVDAPSRFTMPSLPSMPKFQTPTMPTFDFKAPSLPTFQAPSLPSFQAPAASSFMPESFAKLLGANAGEGESRKYMDEEDQTNDDEQDWARIKDKYDKPKLPMVFLHGLFGFSVLGPSNVPALQIQYWRGVREALEELGVEVLMTASPASGNIETRAKAIYQQIEDRFPGREINLIGHSMGGLDARYLITHLLPSDGFTVRSLTTIATPHRGSAFADYLLEDVLGRRNLPALLNLMSTLQMPGGGHAFDALTRAKMAQFNEDTPDDPDVTYLSYGAQFRPSFVDVFRLPWSIIFEIEGENDGLVSVESAKWGNYKATLENVNHLDLVGWVGRVRFAFAELTGKAIRFKPVSFYLAIAEQLAKEGF